MRLPPKNSSFSKPSRVKKISTTPYPEVSGQIDNSFINGFENIKDNTDAKFLEVIDSLRELRRKNYREGVQV